MNDRNCFLCRQPARKQQDFKTDAYLVECERCGHYGITFQCSFNQQSTSQTDLIAISAATRQAFESGAILLLTMENWNGIAAGHTNTPVRQKLAKLLQYLAAKSQYPGDEIRFDSESDYPTCDAKTSGECEFLITHLQESRYLLPRGLPSTQVLSVKGWNEVEPPAGAMGVPGRCFVAMSFADELDEVYLLGIKPAVEQDCGMKAVRMKELHHNRDICDRLLSEIRQAQFVIADFTDPRSGVYYEAGFARALGREVINCCRTDDFNKLHFDTNHLNHIKWTTYQDLRQKLTDRIRATIIESR